MSFYLKQSELTSSLQNQSLWHTFGMKQVLRDGDLCDQVAQFSQELLLPLMKLYFHTAQGQKPQQEQILVKL